VSINVTLVVMHATFWVTLTRCQSRSSEELVKDPHRSMDEWPWPLGSVVLGCPGQEVRINGQEMGS